MHPTLLVCLCGLILSALLLAIRLNKSRLAVKGACVALLLSAALGFVLGKCVYVLCLLGRLLPRYGIAAFIRMAPTEFSFVGMLLGAYLGVVLTAKIFRAPAAKLLDAYAPSFALLSACVKGSEYFLGMHGVGAYLENEQLYFFPLAVKNEWDEYFLAVFMLFALAALVIFVLALLFDGKTKKAPGLLFDMTVYHLCVVLILCENLRAQTITWGFVKVEQLFGALICLAVLLRSCVKYGAKAHPHQDGPTSSLVRVKGKLRPDTVSPVRRFWPVAALFVCAGLIIMVIFALDGKIPAVSNACAYWILGCTLTAMCALDLYASLRRLK